MIDLAGVVDYERAFPHALLAYPKGGGDPVEVGLTLHIKHVDCEAATQAKKDHPGSEMHIYAACIDRWEGDAQLDGEPLPFSPENAIRLLSHPRCKWIQVQTRRVALDIANFTNT